jgi:uncharacterized membrane protein
MMAGHVNCAAITRSDTLSARPRWFHLLLLLGLLVAAGLLRFHRIDQQSLWIDEYWADYLATGRGNSLYQIPRGVIIQSPPRVGFSDAPSWRHIWHGLGSVTHPPMYYLALHGWVDLFGDSDFSTRSMAAVFGLGGIVILFDLMRRIQGSWLALIAAGIMTFAPMQLEYSQTTRPYTMLAFLGLLLCHVLVSIDRLGPSLWRMIVLGGSVAAMALTHYFSAGAIFGAAIYAMIRLRGSARTQTLIAMSAGLLLAALLWGPVFWQTRAVFEAFPNFSKVPGNRAIWIGRAIITAPAQLFLDAAGHWNWVQSIPLALLVYVASPLLSRRSPEMLLWWLWIIGVSGFLVTLDAARGTTLSGVIRYLFIESPAIFAVLATPLAPGRLGMFVPVLAMLCALICGIDRFEIGPEPTQDWKRLSHMLDQSAGHDDIVALTGSYDFEAAYDYFVIAHYMGDWTRPVIFLTEPPNDAVMRQLVAHRLVWIVGHDPEYDTRHLFPGWKIVNERSAAIGDSLWAIVPTQSNITPPPAP